MKTVKMLKVLLLAFGLMVCLAQLCEAEPMGTAFTYQGHLYDANYPADGLYDFQFRLIDDSNTQAGSTLDINDFDVVDGQFTVVLDFGSGAFNGEARWLETAVRPGDSNDVFTILRPRVELTPTPYAIYAETSGGDNDWMVSGDDMYSIPTGNVGIGTTNPGWKLSVVEGGLEVFAGSSGENVTFSTGRFYVTNNGEDIIMDIGESPSDYVIFSNLGSEVMGVKNDGVAIGASYIATTPPSQGMIVKGSVGVGTSVPSEKLEVDGTVKATAFVGNGSGLTGLPVGDSDWTISGTDMYSAVSGNVGIGTTSPDRTLEISGILRVAQETNNSNGADFSYVVDEPVTGHDGLIIDSDTGGGWSDIHLRTRGTTKLFVESGGNVGIGTTSPQNKMDVEGAAVIGSSYSGTNTAPANGLLVEGNVGIGTTSPEAKLHVQDGSILLDNNRYLQAKDSGGTPKSILGMYENDVTLSNWAGGNIDFVIGTPPIATQLLTVQRYGQVGARVGIGAAFPSYNLHVIGDIAYTGNLYDISDVRLKENITPLENALEKVSCLQSIYFNNKDESSDKREVGVIAQDVEAVLPELVSTGNRGYKWVDYTQLSAVLVEAVKELKAENQVLKQRLEDLENDEFQEQNHRLESRLSALENAIRSGSLIGKEL